MARVGPRVEASAAAVRDSGFTVLEGAIPPSRVEERLARVDAANRRFETPHGSNEFLGERTRRLFNLLARDDAFADVPLDEAVLPVVDAVLGPDCLLSSITAVEIRPGETAQPFHCDDGTLPLPRPHAPFTCTAIWALSDFSAETGRRGWCRPPIASTGSPAAARRPRSSRP